MGFGSIVYFAQLAERAAMAYGSAYDLAILRGELLAACHALWVGLFVLATSEIVAARGDAHCHLRRRARGKRECARACPTRTQSAGAREAKRQLHPRGESKNGGAPNEATCPEPERERRATHACPYIWWRSLRALCILDVVS